LEQSIKAESKVGEISNEVKLIQSSLEIANKEIQVLEKGFQCLVKNNIDDSCEFLKQQILDHLNNKVDQK